MATDTIIMVVLICVGAALGLTGLGIVGYRVIKLIKAGRDVGIRSRAQAQEITGRVQRLAPRFRELERKQRAVAEGIERLSTTAHKSD